MLTAGLNPVFSGEGLESVVLIHLENYSVPNTRAIVTKSPASTPVREVAMLATSLEVKLPVHRFPAVPGALKVLIGVVFINAPEFDTAAIFFTIVTPVLIVRGGFHPLEVRRLTRHGKFVREPIHLDSDLVFGRLAQSSDLKVVRELVIGDLECAQNVDHGLSVGGISIGAKVEINVVLNRRSRDSRSNGQCVQRTETTGVNGRNSRGTSWYVRSSN